MTIYDNFPIYRDEFVLSQESLLNYVLVFKDHKMSSGKLGRYIVFSEHAYSDSLRIKFQWLINNPEKFNTSTFKNIDNLHAYQMEGILSLTHVRVISYSKVERIPEESLHVRFVEEVLQPSVSMLSTEDYKKMEYSLKEKATINDEDFEELIKHANLFSKFEKFYQTHLEKQRFH